MLSLIAINSVVVALAVLIHYQFLFGIANLLLKGEVVGHPFKVVLGVFAALVAHTLEIWLFALAFFFMNGAGDWGVLKGNFDGSLLDCAYFSFTSYTTLGFGDIYPEGGIRYLVGIEALTGLLLITWSASFLYYVMQRYWIAHNNDDS